MAFVELENGDFINVDRIETIHRSEKDWIAYFNDGMTSITDADRVQILKTAGFVPIKKEKRDE